MFSAYFELVVLPDEAKTKHKIKLEAKVKRFDCIRFSGYYKGIEPFLSPKGMLFMYCQKANTMVNASDERLTDYVLQSNSLNFSSIYPLLTPEFTGFAYGEPNNKKHLSNGKPNPIYEFKNDGFLFIINPDYTKIELLIIESSRYTIQGYLKQLANGEFDEALQQMRATAKPFYEY
jgi:hypothetical protein